MRELRVTAPQPRGGGSERGGVVCLALEGIMLNSALAYVLGAWYLHDPWLGLLCAVLAGVATAEATQSDRTRVRYRLIG